MLLTTISIVLGMTLLLQGPAGSQQQSKGAKPDGKGGQTQSAGPQQFKGQVKIGMHSAKLEANKLYQLIVDGPKDFSLDADTDGAPIFKTEGKTPNDDKTFCMPTKSGDCDIYVFPGEGFPKATTFNYVLKIKAIAFEPLQSIKGTWTDKDASYNKDWASYHKRIPAKLKAGQLYVIDLAKSGTGDHVPYLFLEDAKGEVVGEGSKNGPGGNARMVVVPLEDGEYRIIATTAEKATGAFALTVRKGQ